MKRTTQQQQQSVNRTWVKASKGFPHFANNKKLRRVWCRHVALCNRTGLDYQPD